MEAKVFSGASKEAPRWAIRSAVGVGMGMGKRNDSRSRALENLPHAQCLGSGPGLGITAALCMRRIAVDDLRELAEATLLQESLHAAEVSTRGGDGRGIEVPGSGQRLAKHGERPSPSRAVVIRRLAPGVFVPFVAAP